MKIEKLDDQKFNEVYQIMEMSFPEDERRPYQEQEKLLSNPLYRIYVFQDTQTQQIQAFAAVWDFEGFGYIEHLAVNPQYRNHGMGAKLLNEVVGAMGKIVCLEVEPPDNEMAARRIGFYKRNNFFFNEYHYMQPPISKGRKAIPLYIMTSGREVTKSEFEQMKNVLYEQVYRVKEISGEEW